MLSAVTRGRLCSEYNTRLSHLHEKRWNIFRCRKSVARLRQETLRLLPTGRTLPAFHPASQSRNPDMPHHNRRQWATFDSLRQRTNPALHPMASTAMPTNSTPSFLITSHTPHSHFHCPILYYTGGQMSTPSPAPPPLPARLPRFHSATTGRLSACVRSSGFCALHHP